MSKSNLYRPDSEQLLLQIDRLNELLNSQMISRDLAMRLHPLIEQITQEIHDLEQQRELDLPTQHPEHEMRGPDA